MRRVLMSLAALVGLVTVGLATAPATVAGAKVNPGGRSSAAAKAHTSKHSNSDPTIYDSTVEPSPGNLPSVGFEATQGTELGNRVNFAGSARVLDSVVVQMSSWGCQSGTSTTCVTTPGSTFNEPIKLNVFKVGNGLTPGSLITSVTQTFAIPYRPSADNVNCTGASAGAWYDSTTDPQTNLPIGCLNGYLTNITFNFGHVSLPNSVIYGIAYNTSDYGSPAYGEATACHATTEGCGYDSLNIALSNEPGAPSVGTDSNNGTIYWDTGYAGFYCDGGTDGSGIFRNDSPEPGDGCWTVGATPDVAPYYIPAVQFNAVTSPSPSFTSGTSTTATHGVHFSFTVSTTGIPIPVLTESKKLPAGVTFHNNGNGTGTLAGTATTVKTYPIKFKATSSTGKATQYFTLVIN
jgi:hypothetical protein